MEVGKVILLCKIEILGQFVFKKSLLDHFFLPKTTFLISEIDSTKKKSTLFDRSKNIGGILGHKRPHE